MKQVFAICIILAILTQSFSKLIILVNFQLNREYIAKNLCVQKKKKGNCCQGSCHLKEQLKEDEKKEQSSSVPSFKDKNETVWFYQPVNRTNLTAFALSSIFITPYLKPETVSRSNSIFHPPKA